eukprot:scaffold1938_cov399-Prasinococcus_capsulatus_cf.AAC.29
MFPNSPLDAPSGPRTGSQAEMGPRHAQIRLASSPSGRPTRARGRLQGYLALLRPRVDPYRLARVALSEIPEALRHATGHGFGPRAAPGTGFRPVIGPLLTAPRGLGLAGAAPRLLGPGPLQRNACRRAFSKLRAHERGAPLRAALYMRLTRAVQLAHTAPSQRFVGSRREQP